HHPRVAGVLADAQVDVEAVAVVPEIQQHVPERQAVLAAAHRHQHLLRVAEHLVVANRPLDLVTEESLEAIAAVGGVVAPDLDPRLLTAACAAHPQAPPDITGRTSTTSSASIQASRVSRRLPLITSTVSGAIPSSRSAWL